jgi:hypothetical protein
LLAKVEERYIATASRFWNTHKRKSKFYQREPDSGTRKSKNRFSDWLDMELLNDEIIEEEPEFEIVGRERYDVMKFNETKKSCNVGNPHFD